MTDTRTLLMDVAEGLFAERGYSATTVRDIVAAANVRQPSLYHFFGNKENLLVELLTDRFTRYCEDLDAALAGVDTPAGVIEAYVSYLLARMAREPVTARFIFSIMFGPQHQVPKSALHPLLRTSDRILPAHIARVANDVPVERSRFAAALVLGMVTPAVLQFLTFGTVQFPPEMPDVIASRGARALDDDEPIFVWPALSEPS